MLKKSSYFQKKIGLAAKAALASKYGTNYTVGNPSELMCKTFLVIYLGSYEINADGKALLPSLHDFDHSGLMVL